MRGGSGAYSRLLFQGVEGCQRVIEKALGNKGPASAVGLARGIAAFGIQIHDGSRRLPPAGRPVWSRKSRINCSWAWMSCATVTTSSVLPRPEMAGMIMSTLPCPTIKYFTPVCTSASILGVAKQRQVDRVGNGLVAVVVWMHTIAAVIRRQQARRVSRVT